MSFVELQGADNVRDLGDIPVRGGRLVVPGLFYRGGALDGLTAEDIALFYGRRSVRCVVDLRTGWERAARPDLIPDGVEDLHIPFYDLEKVGIEYTRKAEGTHANGRDIACDPDDYYRSLANERTVAQMRAGLEAIFARAERGAATYEHCTGGKDRAGVMALLILAVLGADREAILDDYLLTNVARAANEQSIYERFRRLCESDEAAWEMTVAHRARPENLEAFYEAVDARYGSMERFVCGALGFGEQRCEQLRETCTYAG